VSRIEKYLVSYCAPTLAGLKTGGLFNYYFPCRDGLEQSLLAGNRQLNRKGVFLEAIRVEKTHALIFVYRRSRLKEDLRKNGVAEFLSLYGYQRNSIAHCIRHLKNRFASEKKFPHEIGVFLGYPLEDVIGFIKNAGHNSKCVGCWKVYSNECEAMKLFEKYRRCKKIYQKSFSAGRSVVQLTVAV